MALQFRIPLFDAVGTEVTIPVSDFKEKWKMKMEVEFRIPFSYFVLALGYATKDKIVK